MSVRIQVSAVSPAWIGRVVTVSVAPGKVASGYLSDIGDRDPKTGLHRVYLGGSFVDVPPDTEISTAGGPR